MCGFAGYLYINNNAENDFSTIKSMLHTQKHRGPDDDGFVGINTEENYWDTDNSHSQRSHNLFFGFNRLSILDLSKNGHQPMISEDGNVVLMMNGEIYNAFSYRNELEAEGFVFKSTTDTEVALKLYLKYGLRGMLERLNGMFAFAIYDFSLKKLFLARDRFGIKPLYIYNKDAFLAFSSEIKSFTAHKNVTLRLDTSKLDEFLVFRNTINKTLFKDVINVTPGSYYQIDNNGDISNHSYYDLLNIAPQLKPSDTSLNALAEKLQSATQLQMISDVKLGCQLSGGVDSSLVTYFANDVLKEGNLETISIVFQDPRFSEKKYIDEVASKLNLTSRQFELDANYYFDVLEEATWHFEHPINHPNTIGIYLLSKETRKYLTVLLSGEGADEIFAGYGRFLLPSEFSYFSKSFLSEVKRNVKSLSSYLPIMFDMDSRLVLSSSFSSFYHSQKLYSNFDAQKATATRLEILKSIKQYSDTNQRQRIYELITYLPDLLMRQDKMSMAHSIENRVPFLDNDLVEYALGLPNDVLISHAHGKKQTKFLLKELCADIFSHNFSYRKKMGFSIPLRNFFLSDKYRNLFEDKIFPGIAQRGIFNKKYVRELFEKRANLDSYGLDSLWLMSSFELWAEKYI